MTRGLQNFKEAKRLDREPCEGAYEVTYEMIQCLLERRQSCGYARLFSHIRVPPPCP